MTQTPEATVDTAGEADTGKPTRKKSSGLSGMLLPELKQLAGSLGIKGTGAMRKSALVDAITAAQSGANRSDSSAQPAANGASDRSQATKA